MVFSFKENQQKVAYEFLHFLKMNKNIFYGIASFTTLGGSLANLYNALNNTHVYNTAQIFLKKHQANFVEISNNINPPGLADFLNDTIKRTTYIEFLTSGLLFASCIYFANKWKKEPNHNRLETLTLDIDI